MEAAQSNAENREPTSTLVEEHKHHGGEVKKKHQFQGIKHAKTMQPRRVEQVEERDLNFDVMDDPDYPPEAVNSNIIVEEIEMNGRVQKIYKKTYYLIDGKTINITRME